MQDLEIMLARTLNWSLRDIDDTDIESLFGFIHRFGETNGGNEIRSSKRAYCDQVDWL